MTTINGLLRLTNDFHNRAATVRVIDGKVSHRAGRRAWKQLCGVDHCICGGQLGQNGAQEFQRRPVVIEVDFDKGGDKAGQRAAVVAYAD